MRVHIAGRPVLELGSGSGRDAQFLSYSDFSVIALYISAESLRECIGIKSCTPIQADLSRPLPFMDVAFGVVLASLSLHYFLWQDTLRIISEIRRVLVQNGMLLVRVNAVDDVNFGAGKGTEIEKNYYSNEFRNKRFFDQKSVERMLKDMEIRKLSHKTIDRYGKAKQVWEAYAVA